MRRSTARLRPPRKACGACWNCCAGGSTTSSWTCRCRPRSPRCRHCARARHLLVVMTPDLASIRDADRLRELATGLGTSHATIVLNRLGMPGGLKMPLIEQGLGGKPAVQIPELAKQLARAANLGKPALASAPPSARRWRCWRRRSPARRQAACAVSRSLLGRMLRPMKPFGRRLEAAAAAEIIAQSRHRRHRDAARYRACSSGCAPRSWNSSIPAPLPRWRRRSCVPSWSR